MMLLCTRFSPAKPITPLSTGAIPQILRMPSDAQKSRTRVSAAAAMLSQQSRLLSLSSLSTTTPHPPNTPLSKLSPALELMVTLAAMVDGTGGPGIISRLMVSRLKPRIPIQAVLVLPEPAYTMPLLVLSRLIVRAPTTTWALQLPPSRVQLMEDPCLLLLMQTALSSCIIRVVSLQMLLPVVPIKTTLLLLLDMELMPRPAFNTSSSETLGEPVGASLALPTSRLLLPLECAE